MDGYIESKEKELVKLLKGIYGEIFGGILLSLGIVPIWLFALIFAFMNIAEMPPEKWTETEIVYKNINSENWKVKSGYKTVCFFNSENGERYIIPDDEVSVEMLKDELEPGKTYKIVYSKARNGSGWEYLEGVSGKWETYFDVSESVAFYEKQQAYGRKTILWAFAIQIAVSAIFAVLSVRFFGEDRRKRMKEIEEKIAERKDKLWRKEMGK